LLLFITTQSALSDNLNKKKPEISFSAAADVGGFLDLLSTFFIRCWPCCFYFLELGSRRDTISLREKNKTTTTEKGIRRFTILIRITSGGMLQQHQKEISTHRLVHVYIF
jgi:hypothetical protein